MNAHNISTAAKTSHLPPGTPASPVAPPRAKKLRRIKRKKVVSRRDSEPLLADVRKDMPAVRPAAISRPVAKPLGKAVRLSVTDLAIRFPAQPAPATALAVATVNAFTPAQGQPRDATQEKQIALLMAKVDALTELVHRLEKHLAGHTKAATEAATPADPERSLSAKEAIALLGISRASFYELRKQPDFVKPMQIGERTVRYARTELLAWQQARKQFHTDK